MKKLTAIALVAFLSLPANAEEVDRRLDADSDGEVYVSNVAGSVTVEGWDRNEVHVTGTLGKNVKEFITERDGDEVVIKVKVKKSSGMFGGWNKGDTDLHIRVPHGSSIDVSTVSAEIDVEGVHGEQSLETVSGSIDTTFSGEDVDAGSVSGTVEIRGDGSDGEVEGSSVSGSVKIYNTSGDVSADVVSGNVVIEGGSFDDAVLSTVNGRLKFRGELRDGGELNAETVNGSVDVVLDGDVSAEVYIETLNGSIRNCFGPEPRRTSKYGPGKELSFTEGGGDGDIEISTVNGGISLCKK